MLASMATGESDLGQRVRAHPVVRPSVLLRAEHVEGIRALVDADPRYARVRDHLVAQADAMAELPAPERIQQGRRLLGVSRTCFKRVAYAALAFRLSGEPRHLELARRTMLAAAAFADWNPSHFLDVAEMTAALGIGYDWLHGDLSSEDRTTIRRAIVQKGLEAPRRNDWWMDVEHNWNQVCHGGLTIGALAVRDDHPDLAAETVVRALTRVPIAMESYEPDGAYPEGPGYWEYGTGYHVLLIEALRTALEVEAGSLASPAFLASGRFVHHARGPSDLQFNYSDCSRGAGDDPLVPLFWFARELSAPALLDRELSHLPAWLDGGHVPAGSSQRLLPFLLLWAPEEGGREPLATSWQAGGPTPVAFHRTSWEEDATWIGIKGGSPSVNHAHMDVGTFVIDDGGLRWAEDLGREDYHTLESAGIRIWDRAQDADRWTVFRYATRSHNVLMVDDRQQRVDGHAPIVGGSVEGERRFTILDLDEVYRGQLAAARRGIALQGDGTVTIRDEVRTDAAARIRWGMVTRTEVDVVDPRIAILNLDGQTRYLHLDAPADVRWEIFPTAPDRDIEDPNEGFRIVGFHVAVPAGTDATLTVSFHRQRPEGSNGSAPLSDW